MDAHDAAFTSTEEHIRWVMSHPRMSHWLKMALETARERHPVDLLNDLEILHHLLRARCETSICKALQERTVPT
jgi:hypothetical protein